MLKVIIRIVVEGIQTATVQVVNNLTAIDRRLSGTSSDVAIEHAVHHHGVKVGLSRCESIVTHNTAYVCSTRDIGITVTVDDTRIAIQTTYDTTDILRTADAATIDTAVVDAGVAESSCYNSTRMTIGIATADGRAFNDHILDDSIFRISDEGF